MIEIFDNNFFEERGQIEGTLGSVVSPLPLASAHRAPEGSSYSFGSTSELTTVPEWLMKGRERALANLALRNSPQDSPHT